MQEKSIKIPKRIPADVLRRVLGDRKYEDLVTAAYGPLLLSKERTRVEKVTFENLLAYLDGKQPDYQIPPIFKAYLREVPFVQQRLKRWLKESLEAIQNDEDVPGVVVKHSSPTAHGPRKKRKA